MGILKTNEKIKSNILNNYININTNSHGVEIENKNPIIDNTLKINEIVQEFKLKGYTLIDSQKGFIFSKKYGVGVSGKSWLFKNELELITEYKKILELA